MKCVRRFFCLLTLLSLGAFPLAAADGVAPANEELSELGEDLSAAGKTAAESIGRGLKAAGAAISKKAKTFSAKACQGTWVFKNAKLETTMTCSDDGVFELVQKNDGTNTYWRGSYSSTSSSIDCHIIVTGTKGKFFTSSEEVSLNWEIRYKALNESELRLSSDDIPDDANGYDFSNATLFVKN